MSFQRVNVMHRLGRRRLAVPLALLAQIIVTAQNRLPFLPPLRRLVEFHGDTHPHQLSINAANISDQIKTANSIATNSIARFITNDRLPIIPRTPPRTIPATAEGTGSYPARRLDENKKTAWPNSVQLAVLFLAQVNFHSFVQSIRENPDDIFLRHAGGHDFTFKIAKPAGQHNKPDKFRVSHETTLPKRKKRPVKRAQKGYGKIGDIRAT